MLTFQFTVLFLIHLGTMAAGLGPTQVSVNERQLIDQERNMEGTLRLAATYIDLDPQHGHRKRPPHDHR